MKILSVDFGDARTGIAICDKNEMLASPVCVITEYNFEKCAEKVSAKALELKVDEIVVGYPKNMNGTIGERAEKCQKFAELVRKISKIPVKLWDERSTTVTAHQYLNQTNTRGKKRKAIVDVVASTIILETYLEFRKHHREDYPL